MWWRGSLGIWDRQICRKGFRFTICIVNCDDRSYTACHVHSTFLDSVQMRRTRKWPLAFQIMAQTERKTWTTTVRHFLDPDSGTVIVSPGGKVYSSIIKYCVRQNWKPAFSVCKGLSMQKKFLIYPQVLLLHTKSKAYTFPERIF